MTWIQSVFAVVRVHRRIQVILEADAVVAQHFVIEFVFLDGSVRIDCP